MSGQCVRVCQTMTFPPRPWYVNTYLWDRQVACVCVCVVGWGEGSGDGGSASLGINHQPTVQTTLCVQDRRISLAVYVLADFAAEPVVVQLRRIAARRRWPDRTDDELIDVITDAFEAEPIDNLVALCDDDMTPDAVALATAVGVVRQWRVAAWTAEQNRKGITPSTGAVLDKFEASRGELGAASRPKAWGDSASGSARMRASRWRRRWGGRVGKFHVLEEVPIAVMVEKARWGGRWCPMTFQPAYSQRSAPKLLSTLPH